MSDVILRCVDVSVAYGREEVLRGVSLEAPRGACIAFVGENGSGKTTLLRAVLGLLPISGGRIETPFHHRPAGYVPQHQSIDPLFPVSAWDIVATGRYAARPWWRRRDREEMRRIDEALDRFHLLADAHKTFDELSGGMRQKVMLARAFVSEAEVFVMDEPTAGLDEPTEADVLAHLGQLARDGNTVLVAHHGRERILPYVNQFVRIERGTVVVEEAQ